MNLICKLLFYLGESLPGYFVLYLLKVFILINKESVKQLDYRGLLPVHYAARFADLSCISFLLDLYPESITAMTNPGGNNLIHCAMFNSTPEVLIYLCGRLPLPEFGHKYNFEGYTPLHGYLRYKNTLICAKMVSIICDNCPDVVKLPTGTAGSQLPLHLFITTMRQKIFEPVSPEADVFRLLLRLYPAAANMKRKNGNGLNSYYEAGLCGMNTYFLRLLLRADMSINPQHLFHYNYQERRMALFISSGKAIFGGSAIKAGIWRKLWMEKKDLLREVVSYL